MRRRLTALITALVALGPRAALACPVCFGQNDSPLASAMNAGIFLMLGFVVAVLGGFGAFIVHLNRRARLMAARNAGDRAPYHSAEGTA
jgi:hypothetical protein